MVDPDGKEVKDWILRTNSKGVKELYYNPKVKSEEDAKEVYGGTAIYKGSTVAGYGKVDGAYTSFIGYASGRIEKTEKGFDYGRTMSGGFKRASNALGDIADYAVAGALATTAIAPGALPFTSQVMAIGTTVSKVAGASELVFAAIEEFVYNVDGTKGQTIAVTAKIFSGTVLSRATDYLFPIVASSTTRNGIENTVFRVMKGQTYDGITGGRLVSQQVGRAALLNQSGILVAWVNLSGYVASSVQDMVATAK